MSAPRESIPLKQLEGMSVAFLDFAETLGRPLLAAERRLWRWILTAYELKSATSSFRKLHPDTLAYHLQLVEQLRGILDPEPLHRPAHVEPVYALEQLERITVAFLDLCEALGRSLLPSERHAFRWILHAFEDARVQDKCAAMDEETAAPHTELIGALRTFLAPDPIKRIRLKREKLEMTAELNNGNFSVKAPPFRGVSIRRLSFAEARERVTAIAKQADGIAALCRELALVRQRDREEAAQIARIARRLVEQSTAFAAQCEAHPEIPAEPSMEEVLEDMRKLGELMEGPKA